MYMMNMRMRRPCAGRSGHAGQLQPSSSAPHLAGLSEEDCTAVAVADDVLCRCAFEDIFIDSKFLKQGARPQPCTRARPQMGFGFRWAQLHGGTPFTWAGLHQRTC